MTTIRRQVFLNGISIVLCGNADVFHGAAVAWATKVERDHAMVSLPKHATVTECIGTSGIFTISVLSEGQSEIPRQYGGRRQSDPHGVEPADLDFARWDVPVVKGARAHLLCKVRHTVPINEQVVVIAEIADAVHSDDLKPLAYDHHRYFSD